MGIFRRIVRRFLFFLSGNRSGVAEHNTDLDPDREYLMNLHRELERSGKMAILQRCSQPAARPSLTCPLQDITALHPVAVREVTLPDTRILPLEDIQEIVMAEVGQES